MKKVLMLFASMIVLGSTSAVAQADQEVEKLKEDIIKIEKLLEAKKDQLKKLTGEELEDKERKDNQEGKTIKENRDEKNPESESVILFDDENFMIKFVEINEKEDSFFGPSHEIVFEIENRTDESLMIQSDTVSIDGRMVAPSMISLFQEISAGKSAEVKMSILSYDPDEEIPELKGDLEMELNAFSFENLDDFYTYEIMLPLDEIEINE